MPAIDPLTASDLNATFSSSAGAAVLRKAAGAAPPGLPFGDVLTNSISSTPSLGLSPASATPFGPAAENWQSANAQFGNNQFGNAQFGGPQFGSNPFGKNQNPVGQSDNTRSQSSQTRDSQTGSAQTTSTQIASFQSSDANAASAVNSQIPPSPGDNSAATSQQGSSTPTDQPSLLAASLAGGNQASSTPSPPVNSTGNNSTGNSTSKSVTTAQNLAAGAGDAPAQLVHNLLQVDLANGNTSGASKNAATQNAQSKGDENSGSLNAPHALLAGLKQAVEQSAAQANRSPGGQSAQAKAAVDDALNSVPATIAAANGAPRPPAAAISSDGNSSDKKPGKAAAALKVLSASQVDLPATGAATESGASQASSPADSNAAPGIPAGDQIAGQAVPGQQISGPQIIGQQVAEQLPGGRQTGVVAVVGKNAAADAGTQVAQAPAGSAGSTAVASLSLTPNLPSGLGVSSTASFDAGNPVQPTNANDGSQPAQVVGTQAPGTQHPGYLLFGAAPASLQLSVSSASTAQQTAPSASLASLVLDQAAYAVHYSHSNGQQMQLHLNPPELGALQVNVSMHDGVLSARIEAQSTTAQQILTDNISQLKDSLTQQGVNFDRIDVHLAGSNTGSAGTGTADKSFAQQRDGGQQWDQQFVQPENDDAALRAPVRAAQTSRAPMTSLDIMI